MNEHGSALPLTTVEASKDPNNTLRLKIKGRLDVYTTGKIWRDSSSEIEKSNPGKLIIDAEGIEYCDASGIALLIELRLRQENKGGSFEITGLRDDADKLYRLFKYDLLAKPEGVEKPPSGSLIERVGKQSWE